MTTFKNVGTEILVNTNTNMDQYQSSVTALSDGRYVVVWRNSDPATGDLDGSSIKGQILNADGSKAGPEFLVNILAWGSAGRPEVAAFDGGGFVVTHRSDPDAAHPLGADVNSYAIAGRTFSVAADGAVTGGSEFLVNSTVTGSQNVSAVAKLSNGGFVVTYNDGTASIDVRGQLFDAAGNKVGSELLINTTQTNSQTDARVAGLKDGGFVATWEDGSGADYNIRFQRFDANGAKVGPEGTANTTPTGDQYNPDVASWSDGSFVIAWEDYSVTGGDPSGYAIRAQIYNADGTARAGEFLVNTATLNDQNEPRVVTLPDGRFVVTWTDRSNTAPDTMNSAVRGQVFAADGTKLGSEFVVNTTTLDYQEDPQMAATADGRIIITWTDSSAGNFDVRAQIIDVNDVTGDGGRDVFVLGQGGNRVDGGAGTDTAVIGAGYNDVKIVDNGDGTLTLSGKIAGDDFSAIVSNTEVFEFTDGVRSLSQIMPKTIDGTSKGETLTGTDGVEIFNAKGGGDKVKAGAGSDTLNGSSGDDKLYGQDGADTLKGGKNDDYLSGGNGNDMLFGNSGNDKMRGGAGMDTFVFENSLKPSNTDQIVDFTVIDDTISLASSAFTGLVAGSLAAGAFVIGSKALDADDRVIYNAAKGKLLYDADGAGGDKAVEFATLSKNLAMTADDFIVI